MGFIIHMAFLGWALQEAQLPSRLGCIYKSRQKVDKAFQVVALGIAREVLGAWAWSTE